ncbi:MAG TPA: M23 family metallopeptidase [Candidatus Avimonas sp.]|jgi:murein DD-endopeptidase MepM/ murein hydrolase activator NlpD|nr:M23 family metallopeptidase [Clostridiales bacterium]HOB36323.1 M23 family metallopeptidase [Candidatus Avimonas sp.]HQA15838.1 M23 family metallopeptidase [Candidatus Avimonas sp.]HQD37776.1 M23 family metallopeptidase [Candidatus Avimonas sp.]
MVIIVSRKRLARAAVVLFAALLLAGSGCFFYYQSAAANANKAQQDDFIKWVDFNVTYQALDYSIKLDMEYRDSQTPVSFISLLAYLAAKNGNNFKRFKTSQLDAVMEQIKSGKTIEELAAGLKYYDYYLEAYTAALSGLVGWYEIEVKDQSSQSGKRWERRYGIKAFSPIAKGFYYNHYDDFGTGRSYGFKRRHLGHDMMGSVGTPIIAVEGGTVEALGWNQYGGWRIGIRSRDGKRYYYYAHLRKDFPFNKSLKIGSTVKPGDVIGYMGRSGYSLNENTNNIRQTHLHIGLQLIFDESQKECNSEIWIDIYPIILLLHRNRSEVVRNPDTKEYSRVYDIREIIED